MKLLIDELFPRRACQLLREAFGHDAAHVSELGLHGADDHEIANVARADGRAVVTENIVDFAAEPDLVLVCVLKRNLLPGGAQARSLALLIDTWARSNANPYAGHHWPR